MAAMLAQVTKDLATVPNCNVSRLRLRLMLPNWWGRPMPPPPVPHSLNSFRDAQLRAARPRVLFNLLFARGDRLARDDPQCRCLAEIVFHDPVFERMK